MNNARIISILTSSSTSRCWPCSGKRSRVGAARTSTSIGTSGGARASGRASAIASTRVLDLVLEY